MTPLTSDPFEPLLWQKVDSVSIVFNEPRAQDNNELNEGPLFIKLVQGHFVLDGQLHFCG